MHQLTTTSKLVFAILSLVVCTLTPPFISSVRAQDTTLQSEQQTDPAKKRKTVIFFLFRKDYFSNTFPQHKAGVLMLKQTRPTGMFLVYPDKGESVEELVAKVKTLVGAMFFHNPKGDGDKTVVWTATVAPPHKDVKNEVGTIFTATTEKQEAQLALYIRNFDGTEIAYGYFAGRSKDAKKNDLGEFLDSKGGGVKDFEKFWKSIREAK